MQNIESFKIIGVSITSNNNNGKAATDLAQLWEHFFKENISQKVLNKTSEDIFTIYTDYESNYKGNYLAIIGFQVESLANIPEGLIGKELDGGKYKKFTAKGNIPAAIVETWQTIWSRDEYLNRKYSADFEVYGKNSQNGVDSEVDIYIAIK